MKRQIFETLGTVHTHTHTLINSVKRKNKISINSNKAYCK